MHPPAFSLEHQLSDWPECRLGPFGAMLPKLRCKCCAKPPAPVYLVAGLMRRADRGGEAPNWAVELVAGGDAAETL